MSHKSVTKGEDEEVLTRSRNNSFEGDNSQNSKAVLSLGEESMEDEALTIKPETKPKSVKPVIPDKFHNAQEFASFIRLHKTADLADLLPPEPTTDADLIMESNLQQRISAMVHKKNQGYNFMQAIETKKSYCNPSIYEKLVQNHGIRESGTNFTEDIYNPYAFNSACYYDKLREEQAAYMDELEKKKVRDKKLAAQKLAAEKALAAAAAAEGGSGRGKKRTKWDSNPYPRE